MELNGTFLPTAGVVGILPMITYFLLLITFYAFVGGFLFAVSSRSSVAPEHRLSRTMSAGILAIAAISYFLIQTYYRGMLTELAQLTDSTARQTLIRTSYNAIGQFRYMGWAITTPLLLIQTVFTLRVKLSQIKSSLALLLLADFFMIMAGYIGEQQLGPDNEILVGPKLLWGAISTIGYVVLPVVLYRYWKQFAAGSLPEEQQGFKWMALAAVTFWGVYPIGYILTALGVDTNYIHISFSIADVINKVGVGVISYLVGRQVLDRRLSEEATAAAYQVS